MKKLTVLLCLVLVTPSFAAVNQPTNVGSVKASKLAIGLQTVAQLNVLAPDTTGQIVGCSDCTRSAVCISSGAASGNVGAWVILVGTGVFVGSTWSGLQHCQ